jgi:hypothetical protein
MCHLKPCWSLCGRLAKIWIRVQFANHVKSLVSPHLVKTHLLELSTYARSAHTKISQNITKWFLERKRSHAATSLDDYSGDSISLNHRPALTQGLVYYDSRLKRKGFADILCLRAVVQESVS